MSKKRRTNHRRTLSNRSNCSRPQQSRTMAPWEPCSLDFLNLISSTSTSTCTHNTPPSDLCCSSQPSASTWQNHISQPTFHAISPPKRTRLRLTPSQLVGSSFSTPTGLALPIFDSGFPLGIHSMIIACACPDLPLVVIGCITTYTPYRVSSLYVNPASWLTG